MNWRLIKSSITHFNPFSWDAAFDGLDRLVHFGYQPWEILQPIIGYGPITKIIDFNYYFWFITLAMFVLHFAFFEKSEHNRNRALLAFFLAWSVGGTGLAILFSSVGPCYFGNLGIGYDPYRDLVTYLSQAHENYFLISQLSQPELWEIYVNKIEGTIFTGISAMPSMHVAQAFLLVLSVWGKSLFVRNLAIAHCLLIFIGSVHLGWHYAVDGYLAVILTGLTWIAADYLACAWKNHRNLASVTTLV